MNSELLQQSFAPDATRQLLAARPQSGPKSETGPEAPVNGRENPLLHQSFSPDATRQLLAADKQAGLKTGTEAERRKHVHAEKRFDHYVVKKLLGKGAFGEVYHAFDEAKQQNVAIKVFKKKLRSNSTDPQDFITEASIAARLRHPNIVPLLDVGKTQDGEWYMVSRLIEGLDLGVLAKSGGLMIEESARIVALAADALHYAHQLNLIHRDVKPANILVDIDMTPFITDFGVATEADCAVHSRDDMVGTPYYMSPEQIGCRSYTMDERSDVFSLGVVLYQLLTGKLPFEAETLEDLAIQIEERRPAEPHEANPAVPRPLSKICMRALSKLREDRYQNAEQLCEALSDWLADPVHTLRAERKSGVEGDEDNFLMNCPNCNVSIPSGDRCPLCSWTENEEQAKEFDEMITQSFAARDKTFFRNFTIGLIAQVLVVLGFVLTGVACVTAWVATDSLSGFVRVMLIIGGAVLTAILGLVAAIVKRTLPVELHCPACDASLHDFGTVKDICPNCDARLRDPNAKQA